jgi:hypothetical protein
MNDADRFSLAITNRRKAPHLQRTNRQDGRSRKARALNGRIGGSGRLSFSLWPAFVRIGC